MSLVAADRTKAISGRVLHSWVELQRTEKVTPLGEEWARSKPALVPTAAQLQIIWAIEKVLIPGTELLDPKLLAPLTFWQKLRKKK